MKQAIKKRIHECMHAFFFNDFIIDQVSIILLQFLNPAHQFHSLFGYTSINFQTRYLPYSQSLQLKDMIDFQYSQKKVLIKLLRSMIYNHFMLPNSVRYSKIKLLKKSCSPGNTQSSQQKWQYLINDRVQIPLTDNSSNISSQSGIKSQDSLDVQSNSNQSQIDYDQNLFIPVWQVPEGYDEIDKDAEASMILSQEKQASWLK